MIRARRMAAMALAGVTLVSGAGAQGYAVPEALDDGWPTAALEAVGLAREPVVEMLRRLDAGEPSGVDGVVVARRGRLVIERYFGDYGRDDPHPLRSATKSVVAILVGIAIDRGWIAGVDAEVLAFFPEYDTLLYPDPAKRAIAIEHLLTMSSGLECDDFNEFSAGNEERMYLRDDWIKFTLDLPLSQSAAGERWSYCTGGVMTLGGVLHNATGKTPAILSRELLFAPLGIDDFTWGEPTRRGRTNVCGDLALRPRDLAKIGQLVLDGGIWRGQRVVSEAWIRAMTSRRIGRDNNFFLEAVAVPEDTGYGYLWWHDRWRIGERSVEVVYATGAGGQKLFVFPGLEMVVAMTGSNFTSGDLAHRQPVELLAATLLPAALAATDSAE